MTPALRPQWQPFSGGDLGPLGLPLTRLWRIGLGDLAEGRFRGLVVPQLSGDGSSRFPTPPLGTVCDPIWLRASQMVDFLRRHHPELHVHLHQGLSGQVQRDILEGRLTAGWILGPVDEPALTTRVLTSVRMRIVGPRPWAQQIRDASLEELADFPWISSPESCAYHRQRQVVFSGSGRKPRDCCYADSERAMLGLVIEGLGLCLVREEITHSGQRDGSLAVWNGTIADLHLRFAIPTIRRDEPIGRALMDASVRAWGQRVGSA